ncbi:MAG: alpha-amylase family glycosyl hydrolase [Syntrophorhabdaceae bacterium]|nr:alpha-amylase family glycosyl hydrolase [Syntrophorhabdaceae bacterium]
MEYEFHISRNARDRYKFDDSIFNLRGDVIIPNIKAARTLAQKINEKRILSGHPDKVIKAGDIASMGLIDEILHFVVLLYREQVDGNITRDALEQINSIFTKKRVDMALYAFAEEFPVIDVYRNNITLEEYINGETSGVNNREIILEEMLLLWLANMNPAFSPFSEFFDDTRLKKDTLYLYIIAALREFLDKKPHFGPYNQNLIDMLRSPAILVPYSLKGQLDYIREHWGFLLKRYARRLLGAIDLITEESKITFTGPGKAQIYDFKAAEFEAESFTPDKDWMPRLVLIAKNIYVWLDQLSKKYGYHIAKINEIPDEELDILKNQGFSGLWLIGIWERSPASQRIKQLCGNPEAVASAYSLFDYQIAYDLGGEEAYNNLKERAWSRGIRLASDMVPNHVGIYSKWVIEHPDWFISLDYNPFPWYSFSGPDLSHDERVCIQIEDHYYTKTDAAVVFRRLDRATGDERFIYHGNDGTSMPWNDTAQLNYLNPHVRESMIETILYVAKKFPIIRFDAAMTLTKKHYQRLWFPEPGEGGAIPTRAEYGMTKEEFNRNMPFEFWREVVDRIAKDAPDTLLLAEAFWLLEGYFVRTLGMHRVYNSAFMNMLRDEENGKYRTVMKNILEFDPEILRRLVNFMNNPDERTAVDQFGKDDKYFGICTLMVTMPGLPMFGHGQIEGYTEKYGMEYKKAYIDERPDTYLIERHERQIFPLMHRRHIFAGVENFLLYDFFTEDGHVNEDVFAYSNRHGNQRVVVIYNNRYNSTKGWIKTSAAYSEKTGESKRLIQRNLIDGLMFEPKEGSYIVFTEHITGLTFIRSSQEIDEKGLYIELGPYRCLVFLDFYEAYDNDEISFSRLNDYLRGRGTPNLYEAMDELKREDLCNTFREIINTKIFTEYARIFKTTEDHEISEDIKDFTETIRHKYGYFIHRLNEYVKDRKDLESLPEGLGDAVVNELMDLIEVGSSKRDIFLQREYRLYTLLGLIFSWSLDYRLIQGLGLKKILSDNLRGLGLEEGYIADSMILTDVFLRYTKLFEQEGQKGIAYLLKTLINDDAVKGFIGVNLYQDTIWFSKERLEEFLWWLHIIIILVTYRGLREDKRLIEGYLEKTEFTIEKIIEASQKSGYQLKGFMESIEDIEGL